MKSAIALADHLAPDTVNRLERAAELRHYDGSVLKRKGCALGAIYLFGYSVEMCLAAAYFRAAGYSSITVIDRDTRLRHMTRARKLLIGTDGKALMNNDPHPIVGWARCLVWQRSAAKLSAADRKRLTDALRKAEILYKHWRPELRYKTNNVTDAQLGDVFKSSEWFLEQRSKL